VFFTPGFFFYSCHSLNSNTGMKHSLSSCFQRERKWLDKIPRKVKKKKVINTSLQAPLQNKHKTIKQLNKKKKEKKNI